MTHDANTIKKSVRGDGNKYRSSIQDNTNRFSRPEITKADAIAQPMNKRNRGSNHTWHDNKQNGDTIGEFHAYHNRHDSF